MKASSLSPHLLSFSVSLLPDSQRYWLSCSFPWISYDLFSRSRPFASIFFLFPQPISHTSFYCQLEIHPFFIHTSSLSPFYVFPLFTVLPLYTLWQFSLFNSPSSILSLNHPFFPLYLSFSLYYFPFTLFTYIIFFRSLSSLLYLFNTQSLSRKICWMSH